ncbi:MAG: dynamin family protein [Ruminococcus sp.]
MANFLEVKKNVSAFMEQCCKVIKKLGYDTSAKKICETKDAFDNRKLMIPTIGEAKRGKSLMLNVLLNESEPLFPVDINICTNVVTIVSYGETESIEVYIEDPSAKGGIRKESIDRSSIADYVSEQGNPNNYKKIKYLEIKIPNELLKEGIVLVDTPGVGSLNINHAETTYNFLPSADLILFVGDACSGYTESELDFLKRSYSYCRNIIFPITKKDLSMNYQEIVDDDINKITDTIGIPKEEIKIVPVSSAAKLRFLRNGNKSMYKNSNYEALENTIWSTIAKNKADILIRPFLLEIKQELDKISDNITAQDEMLNADKDQIKELEKAFNDEQKRLEMYQKDGVDIKYDLNTFFQNLSIKTNNQIQNISYEADALLEQTEKSLDTKICKEKNYKKLLMDINDVICKGTNDVKDMMVKAVESQIIEIRNSLGLDLDVNITAIDRINFVGDRTKDIEFKKKKLSDKLINATRGAVYNAGGCGIIGGVVGGVLGTAAGIFLGVPISGLAFGIEIGGGLGSVLGAAKGCASGLARYNAVDVNTVRREISKYINKSMQGIRTLISEVSLELNNQTVKILNNDLNNRIEEIKENRDRIKRNVSTAGSDISKKQAELTQQKALIHNLNNTLDAYDNKLTAYSADNKPQSNNAPVSEKPESGEGKTEQASDVISYGFI